MDESETSQSFVICICIFTVTNWRQYSSRNLPPATFRHALKNLLGKYLSEDPAGKSSERFPARVWACSMTANKKRLSAAGLSSCPASRVLYTQTPQNVTDIFPLRSSYVERQTPEKCPDPLLQWQSFCPQKKNDSIHIVRYSNTWMLLCPPASIEPGLTIFALAQNETYWQLLDNKMTPFFYH